MPFFLYIQTNTIRFCTFLFMKCTTLYFRESYSWDRFPEPSQDKTHSSEIAFWNSTYRIAKVIFAVVLFVLVLGTAVLSKCSLFLLVSNMFPPNEMRNTSLKTANGYFRYHSPGKCFNYLFMNSLECLLQRFSRINK